MIAHTVKNNCTMTEILEDLRVAASAIRTYMPETLPAVHFARLLAESAAEAIEAFLTASASTPAKAAPFNALCYGAKFRYADDTSKVYVKLGRDLVANWDDAKVSDTWIGQGLYSFRNDGDLTATVYLVSDVSAPNVERRKTFVIPEGHEAVRGADGRATGEVRPITTPASNVETSES